MKALLLSNVNLAELLQWTGMPPVIDLLGEHALFEQLT